MAKTIYSSKKGHFPLEALFPIVFQIDSIWSSLSIRNSFNFELSLGLSSVWNLLDLNRERLNWVSFNFELSRSKNSRYLGWPNDLIGSSARSHLLNPIYWSPMSSCPPSGRLFARDCDWSNCGLSGGCRADQRLAPISCATSCLIETAALWSCHFGCSLSLQLQAFLLVRSDWRS